MVIAAVQWAKRIISKIDEEWDVRDKHYQYLFRATLSYLTCAIYQNDMRFMYWIKRLELIRAETVSSSLGRETCCRFRHAKVPHELRAQE